MFTKSKARQRNSQLILAKCFVVLSMLVQLFRVFGTGVIFYNEIDLVVLKQQTLEIFHPAIKLDSTEQIETSNFSDPLGSILDLKILEEKLDEVETKESREWEDRILISLPVIEIVVSWILIYFIVGPLSKEYTSSQWLKWLVRMRIFWMRLIWTLTAIAYSAIVVRYRKDMFALTNKTKYLRTPEWYLLVNFICIEYFSLGILECFVKIMSSETLLLKLRKSSAKLPKTWRKIYMFSYHTGMFAYVARNFSMSLYFGLLSAFIVENNQEKSPFAGLTLVLQVYLAIIRGRFYGFFMHVFLSPFLLEEDDDTFKRVKKGAQNDGMVLEEIVTSDGAEKVRLKNNAANNGGSKVHAGLM